MAAVLRKITNRNYNNTLLGESLEVSVELWGAQPYDVPTRLASRT